jgi:hypothetical protein
VHFGDNPVNAHLRSIALGFYSDVLVSVASLRSAMPF